MVNQIVGSIRGLGEREGDMRGREGEILSDHPYTRCNNQPELSFVKHFASRNLFILLLRMPFIAIFDSRNRGEGITCCQIVCSMNEHSFIH